MEGKKSPMRKCVGCNEMKDKGTLLRVVKTPEGTFVLDSTHRANGRGAYVCKNSDCFEKAVKNRGLERSLKCKVPEDILEELKQEI